MNKYKKKEEYWADKLNTVVADAPIAYPLRTNFSLISLGFQIFKMYIGLVLPLGVGVPFYENPASAPGH